MHIDIPISIRKKIMEKIWSEDEVTSETLQAHFINSGLSVERASEKSFGARSKNGLYIVVRIDDDRHYLRFNCYFDLDKTRSHLEKLVLVQRYNYDIFFANFSLGKNNGDLIVSYVMSFEMGLIAGQMMHVFRRFSRLLDNLIAEENEDNFIVIGGSDDDITPAITTESEDQ